MLKFNSTDGKGKLKTILNDWFTSIKCESWHGLYSYKRTFWRPSLSFVNIW